MEINGENIEALLFDYAEGSLTQAECEEVETYLDLHSEYRQLLAMYDKNVTIEKPLDIVYDEKEELYSTIAQADSLSDEKKKGKIILISRYIKWISGAAAVLVLFFAVKTVYNFSSGDNSTAENINNPEDVKDYPEQMPVAYSQDTEDNTQEQTCVKEEPKPIAEIQHTELKQEDISDNKEEQIIQDTQVQEQIPVDKDVVRQNSVAYIVEKDELPDNMDTIKIIYVKSPQPRHRNSFINYVNRRTGGMIDKAKERIAYKF